MTYIDVKNLTKSYQMEANTIYANQNLTFAINEGELVIILGASGAGKSTFLNLLGGMDQADSGQLVVDGTDLVNLSEYQKTEYRRKDVGFVFQFYNLIPNLTAKKNVELAVEIAGSQLDAGDVLTSVGLKNRIDNFPAQLSGGEQQRVAIARAVAKQPKLLLCDEPTGALDYETGKQFLLLLQDMERKKGATVVIVTHNAALAPIGDRVIHLRDAKVEKVELNLHPQDIQRLEY